MIERIGNKGEGPVYVWPWIPITEADGITLVDRARGEGEITPVDPAPLDEEEDD